MLAAGVDGVRINMSHGTQDEKAADIRAARAAAARTNRPLAILIDLSGPKIRTRTLKNHEPVTLVADQQFTITTPQFKRYHPGSNHYDATARWPPGGHPVEMRH